MRPFNRRGSGPLARPSNRRQALRQRYYVVISFGYILAGLVIASRSLLAHVAPIAILGAIFIALGLVRLRDFFRLGGRFR